MIVRPKLWIYLDDRLRLIGCSRKRVRAQSETGYERNSSGNEQRCGERKFRVRHTILGEQSSGNVWVGKTAKMEQVLREKSGEPSVYWKTFRPHIRSKRDLVNRFCRAQSDRVGRRDCYS